MHTFHLEYSTYTTQAASDVEKIAHALLNDYKNELNAHLVSNPQQAEIEICEIWTHGLNSPQEALFSKIAAQYEQKNDLTSSMLLVVMAGKKLTYLAQKSLSPEMNDTSDKWSEAVNIFLSTVKEVISSGYSYDMIMAMTKARYMRKSRHMTSRSLSGMIPINEQICAKPAENADVKEDKQLQCIDLIKKLLPVEDWELLHQYHVLEISCKDIAEQLSLPYETIKKRLIRARKKAYKIIIDHYGDSLSEGNDLLN